MEDVEAIHRAYLTPAHKRKGKGGRQPAADPRLDPGIDPKRARRILANRLSAARSKMKQKSHVEVRPLLLCLPSVCQVLCNVRANCKSVTLSLLDSPTALRNGMTSVSSHL